ncbi:MAG: hypothetical protein L0Y38_03530 [Methylococcaceae bacterium]|nr:hypothetical protein [Methylococcaceae bacterium]MCI0732880.1 hypothetical protein [Methylococcaceae bacterium]
MTKRLSSPIDERLVLMVRSARRKQKMPDWTVIQPGIQVAKKPAARAGTPRNQLVDRTTHYEIKFLVHQNSDISVLNSVFLTYTAGTTDSVKIKSRFNDTGLGID